MKTLAKFAVVAVGILYLAGCDTPGYTSAERFQHIGRNWGYEYEQAQEDIDTLLLLRPAGHLTPWNVQ